MIKRAGWLWPFLKLYLSPLTEELFMMIEDKVQILIIKARISLLNKSLWPKYHI